MLSHLVNTAHSDFPQDYPGLVEFFLVDVSFHRYDVELQVILSRLGLVKGRSTCPEKKLDEIQIRIGKMV